MLKKSLAVSAPLLALGLFAGCTGGAGSERPSESDSASAPSSDAPSSAAPAPSSERPIPTFTALDEHADLAKKAVPVNPTKAIAIAHKEAGKGTVHSIELEFEHKYDAWDYEIEILRGTTDHEVHVNAVTGKVQGSHSEHEDDHEHAVDPSKPLAVAGAMKLAQKKAKGRVADWSLEYDEGHPEYEFSIGDKPHQVDVKVNADTKRAYLDD